MVDLGAAWGDLTPEQLRETVEDVTYFLGEFGSTGAVRRKLHEQSSDIHHLGNSVRRFLGKPQEPEKLYSEEGYGFIINGIVGCDESLDDEVDRTMVDVKFFLEKFGATRTCDGNSGAQRCEARW
ncbi:hypothetical protein BBJ29_003269 [Phytophthora kernoviae]|uniref:Uncharacterized protein n=1 Tax=Phytophthora kernoviae TaxID=325452 RepID=A0A3F2RYU1_9STRA|nr:hypothetical protein BBJ29_003269 [Phytophthora kernoviae]RLN66934.1 hypothetical protein BBP00_00001928 [Phytophthora kernoviae]